MTAAARPFDGFPLEAMIAARARDCGIDLTPAAVDALAEHARAVWGANPRLHLTTIAEPREFVERHLGESFQGAALLPADLRGTLVDLGSGNGYPGLPLVAARPGLRAVLAEASMKKAEFLRGVVALGAFARAEVLARQVQRAADLSLAGSVQVLVSRAAGGWDKIIPRLVSCLADDGLILVWAGEEMDRIRGRVAWRKIDLLDRHALVGRDRSWAWLFRRRN